LICADLIACGKLTRVVRPADLVVGLAGIFFLTWGLGRLVRKHALRAGLLDTPNDRSSHEFPTPRGGGLAIVSTTLIALLVLRVSGQVPVRVAVALGLGGGLVALTGAVDDWRGLAIYLRLCAHAFATFLAVFLIGNIQAVSIGGAVIPLGPAGWITTVLALVWFLNLFNFMDGIDGIAASEGIFMGLAGGVLAMLNGAPVGIVTLMLALAAACAGFLPLNWPPARLFMGDVGSGFLGFVIGVLALTTVVSGVLPIWTWILLCGTFLVDATVTLVRRVLRGDKAYEAHRSHAYQWLSRKWHSHGQVTLWYIAVDVAWLLPLAWVSTKRVESGAALAVIGIVPLTIAALISGAGRPESRPAARDPPGRDDAA
jgi:Fuc2NAc and GlcNAc transferase